MSTVADVVDPVDDGGDVGASLRLTASLDVLADVRAFVRATSADLGADSHAIIALVQSVDEWVTNVVVHGYGVHGPVAITMHRDGDEIVVRVRDEAPSFDPATARPFDRDVPLEERPLGGMGIALINDLCDAFEHRTLSGSPPHVGNEVTMRRLAVTPGTDGGEL